MRGKTRNPGEEFHRHIRASRGHMLTGIHVDGTSTARPGFCGRSNPDFIMSDMTTLPAGVTHGAARLPAVTVESYNVEVKDDEGFVGDRANKGAFQDLLGKWRKIARRGGEDPLGEKETEEIVKKELDRVLAEGNPEAAVIVQSAIEDFAQELATVIKRFLKLKAWRDTERLVIGGGFSGRRVGELAVARTGVLLKADKFDLDLTLIRNDPDEAGLVGGAHLAPHWIFKGHDAILAADIGGTNIRAGVVTLGLREDRKLGKAAVWKLDRWRHGDEKKLSRSEAVEKLSHMLEKLIDRAEAQKLRLAPFIAVGCPGVINENGQIDRGAHNLPGKWEGKNFNLPAAILDAIPKILSEDTVIVMHNDAVVQGLSERPFMDDVERWGVLTIGTGLGNALYRNRHKDDD
jgi:predicted NBD/HSP70 family sugar kinase